MISTSLKIFLSIALIFYFAFIIIFLRKRALSLKYTLLWIISGVGMGLLLIFPQILDSIVNLVDIKSTVNGLFAFFIFFILVILMSITSIVSKQSEKIKTLIQEYAFMEKRLRELENNNKT